MDRFDLEEMEGRMDLHCAWELLSHCCRGDDMLARKGTNEYRSQLFRLYPERQVSSREPHVLAHLVVRSWRTGTGWQRQHSDPRSTGGWSEFYPRSDGSSKQRLGQMGR